MVGGDGQGTRHGMGMVEYTRARQARAADGIGVGC